MSKRTKLIIQIVVWNSRKFLKNCLNSIFEQTFKDFLVLLIDNNSTDQTIEFIKESYSPKKIKQNFNKRNKIFVFQNNKNLGFSGAHNQGLNLMNSEYVLIMNPDIILEPDFLANIIKIADKKKQGGSFSGKLLKVKTGDIECEELIKTKIIDSVGLTLFKNYRFADQGQGEEDKGQFNQEREIFGVSGACALYRREALEQSKLPLLNNQFEYFDQDFFAYQEDVDLAWRLRLFNWSCFYVPQARAYHFRQVGLREKPGLFEMAKKHRQRSNNIEFFSYRNHLWLLLKNIYWSEFFYCFFWILLYYLGKKIYLFFFKPRILFKATASFLTGALKMIRKRKIIMSKAKIGPKEFRKWRKHQ